MFPWRLPTVAVVLATAAALLAVAGCGSSGPSAADAKASYAPIKVRVLALGSDIGTAVSDAGKTTDRELALQFATLASRGRAEIAALDKLEVPDDLVDERNALRDAIETGTGDLSDIATAARASNAPAARTAAEQLVADSEQIRTARADFEKALNAAAQ